MFNPVEQQLSLGAGMRVHGDQDYFGDPADDCTLSVAAGTSEVTRTFQLPGTTNVTYDVVWGLASAGFGTTVVLGL